MKKLITLLFASILLSVHAYGQKVIDIKTSDGDGMDAHTWLTSPNQNFGQGPIMAVRAWTELGDPQTSRAYFYFDLDNLPADAIVSKAIFTVTADMNDPRPQEALDPDSIVLNPISESWLENGIVWDNAPDVDSSMRVSIMQNTDDYPTYSFDITDIVKYWQSNPSQNYGARLAFKNEAPYTIFYIASGENNTTSIHPNLKIEYTQPVGIAEAEKDLFSVGTIGKGQFIITGNNNNSIESYSVFNTTGQQLSTDMVNGSKQVRLSLYNQPSGIYILEVRNRNGLMRKTIINN